MVCKVFKQDMLWVLKRPSCQGHRILQNLSYLCKIVYTDWSTRPHRLLESIAYGDAGAKRSARQGLLPGGTEGDKGSKVFVLHRGFCADAKTNK